MDAYLFRLGFRTPAHFGDTGIDLENTKERVESDALFSALINVMSMSHRTTDVNNLIDGFRSAPPFRISSLFVWDRERYFLPRPMKDEHISSELKREMGKDLKKLRWLDLDGFQQWNSELPPSKSDVEAFKEMNGSYGAAFRYEIRPRVALDRATNSSSLYHCGYVHFRREAGLYGLVSFESEEFKTLFKELLTLLGHTGLGGEKTYGCGLFDVLEFERAPTGFQTMLRQARKAYTLLSLYHPSTEEITDVGRRFVSYDIARHKGWISDGRFGLPLKRKSLGFITEGSVAHTPLNGQIADVTPDDLPPGILSHRVYRYGLAFTAPLGGANG
jgi:CRISPR-associated protein Csm4